MSELNPTAPPPPVEGYITKKELAARLGKDMRTVNNWMRYNQLPHYKVGRTVLFKWSEVERFFERHCRVAPLCEPASK